jgi:hypothetical protein
LNIGRKRRAPNSIGTCWKVNPECKSYLIHTLKKSIFWHQNSHVYPKLSALVKDYDAGEPLKHYNHHNGAIGGEFKKNDMDSRLVEVEENSNLSQNLLEFVQKEHKIGIVLKPLNSPSLSPAGSPLSLNEENNSLKMSNLDSNDLAAVAVLANAYSPRDNSSSSSKLDLSFSSSSSSLSSAFSTISSSTSLTNSTQNYEINDSNEDMSSAKRQKLKYNEIDLNSDLEIEVASTLVGMKWLFNNKK